MRESLILLRLTIVNLPSVLTNEGCVCSRRAAMRDERTIISSKTSNAARHCYNARYGWPTYEGTWATRFSATRSCDTTGSRSLNCTCERVPREKVSREERAWRAQRDSYTIALDGFHRLIKTAERRLRHYARAFSLSFPVSSYLTIGSFIFSAEQSGSAKISQKLSVSGSVKLVDVNIKWNLIQTSYLAYKIINY